MNIVFLLLGKVISDAFSQLPVLRKEDISLDDAFLVYIYYSRPNVHCPACESFNQSISDLQKYIPVKKINFFEDPKIASRFYTFLFPSFVVRDKGRSYHLDVDSFEELEEIIRDRKWTQFKPIRLWMDVDSYFINMYSLANCIFFKAMQRLYVVFDTVPEWAINFGFSAIIGYMVYSICLVFMVPPSDKKKE
ncbi:uncharacterized protein Eint_041550 [Encephalitozoon intestinalis ATCC 50506]|uniref:Thioredoxin domain-containing protein n=1 Tax=Encephalitozoon intestinalis (strain ATCC 50506) TaxID=876142 RepID=E0S6V7_ENCIT|nr:uncharacterized protein Eint_041550 [Encephalitozoon intestinalis ATCC 50506]ADM11442.1 hypothetical protein Eint_041550 [Encephalitozoon intestinalis ATCC 50506]UTX45138.1 hypothetical protein GPK93_04g06780 [Encephalitozoon intestinalis]